MLTKRFLVNIAFFFCFFPFLKVLPIEAETQPVAGLIALAIMFIYGVKRTRYSIVLLWLIYVIIGYCFITIVLRPFLIPKITLHTIAYLIPLFIFLALYDKMSLLSVKLYFLVLLLWLGLGFVQYFDFFAFLKPAMNRVLSLVIPRFYSVQLGGTRGVLFFASDTASAARVIFLFLATAGFFLLVSKINRYQFYLAVLATILMLLMNKSGTVGLLFAIFFLSMFWVQIVELIRRGKLIMLLYISVCIAVIIGCFVAGLVVASRHGYKSRFAEIADITYRYIYLKRNISIYTLSYIGGCRFPLIYVGYASTIQNYGLGHGIVSWIVDFDAVAKSVGVYPSRLPLRAPEQIFTGMKPNSYASALALDTGVLGLFMLLVFLSLFFVFRKKGKLLPMLSGVRWAMVITAVFHILLNDLITIPTPWLILGYVWAFDNDYTPDIRSAYNSGSIYSGKAAQNAQLLKDMIDDNIAGISN